MIWLSVLTLTAITILLATLLVLARRFLHVEDDPRIDEVEALLPHVNCGACGYPGCRAFAEALVQQQAQPVQCTVSSATGHSAIAHLLGVPVGSQEKRVARLACAGGNNVAPRRAVYTGLQTCRAAATVSGGGKACAWGCLGFGDCAKACTFDALHMNANDLPIVAESKCTACGDCVRACPKDLFSIHPVSHQLWVACKNQEMGDNVLAECEVACTACGRCALDAPKVISMHNNLPVVNYLISEQSPLATARCPTGAIVWIATDGNILKGAAAKPIVRTTPLAGMAT